MDALARVVHEYFVKQGWPFEVVHEDPLALVMPFTTEQGSWSCQASAFQTAFVFASVLDVKMPEGRRPAMAEFLTRVNYSIPIGGHFDMDFADGEIRFQSSVFLGGSSVAFPDVTTEIVEGVIGLNVGRFDTYLPAVMAMIYADDSAEAAFARIP